MHLGSQCVLFGSRLAQEPERVLGGFAGTGIEGVELGARFFGLERSAELLELLEKNQLKLAALHTNMLLTDLVDKPEEAREYFRKAGLFLKDYPVKNIMFTPLPLPAGTLDAPISQWDPRLRDPKAFIPIAKKLDEYAQMLADMGVAFNFHNHNYEFADNGLIFYGILDNAPTVKSGLDIGWIYAAGFDAMKIIDDYGERIGYVHLRDYKKDLVAECTKFSELHDNVFVDLGQGDVDYPALMRKLSGALGKDGWATVEYETGEKDWSRYVQANTYLRGILEQMD